MTRLAAMLDAVSAALVAGDLAAVEAQTEAIAAAAGAFTRGDALTPAEAALLRQKSDRARALSAGAARGVQATIRRLRDIQNARKGTTTYGPAGQAQRLPGGAATPIRRA